MSAILQAPARLLAYLDDRMNPIVVKELRQAVQSNFIIGTLNLFLLVNLVVISTYLINSSDIGSNMSAGRDVFQMLHGIMLCTALLFVPTYTAIRLAAERSETNIDLLFISSIPPAKIVWGKLLAGMVIAGLIYSACLPFLTLTYLLRGIDLPSIVVVLGLDVLLITAGIAGAIFVGCLPVIMAVKGLLILGTMVGLLIMTIIGIGSSWDMIRRGVGSAITTTDFWIGAMVLLVNASTGVVLACAMATSLVTPPTANRALPVRIQMTVMWLISGVIFMTLAMIDPTGSNLITVWVGFTVGVLCLTTLVAVSERDTLDFRIRRTIPQTRLLRILWLPFYSGSVSGLIWIAIISVLTLLAVLLVPSVIRRSVSATFFSPYGGSTRAFDDLVRISTVLIYVVAYALSAMALRWWLLRKWIKPVATATITLILMAIGVVGPWVVAFIASSRWDSVRSDSLMIANPLGGNLGSATDSYLAERLIFSSIWALIALVFCVRPLMAQLRAFRPPEPDEFRGPPSNTEVPSIAEIAVTPAAPNAALSTSVTADPATSSAADSATMTPASNNATDTQTRP